MTNHAVYLCYDVKGIQQFIFSIPKLKYIVGASLLIDNFDRSVKLRYPQNTVFTGGGRGILFDGNNLKIDSIRQVLVESARQYGLDLRIGVSKDFSEVVHCADDLYPYVPDSLDGEPCRISGLWPTTNGQGIHPLVEKRREAAGRRNEENSFDQKILNDLKGKLPTKIQEHIEKLEFLSSVDAKDDDEKRGYYGAKALGDRNRWAVIALDGNDMGSQFQAFERKHKKDSDESKMKWYCRMSQDLDACTREAFYTGLAEAITQWWENDYEKLYPKPNDCIVLPFRPLILGGDDILCLAHCSYAMDLAKTIIENFEKLSEQRASEASKNNISDLWPGTGNRLSISAGIAYTGVSLPLHTSIPYAESLLGSAKGKYRQERKENEPTPAAIDWEHITESMLDTPTARRNRDLRFIDDDLDGTEFCLTRKPYKVGDDLDKLLGQVKKLSDPKKYPRSLLVECRSLLAAPWSARIQRLAAMKKMNPSLVTMIAGKDFDDKPGSTWIESMVNGKSVLTTTFVDIVDLLEEGHRMEQTTVE